MWRETVAFEGVKIIKVCIFCSHQAGSSDTDNDKVGTLDDDEALNAAKPASEFFIPSRVPWVQAVPGAEQKEAM